MWGWNKIQTLQSEKRELAEDITILTNSVNLLISASDTTDSTLGTLMAKSEAQLKLLAIQNKHLAKLQESNEDVKRFLGLTTPNTVSGMLNNARTRTDGAANSAEFVGKERLGIGGSSP